MELCRLQKINSYDFCKILYMTRKLVDQSNLFNLRSLYRKELRRQ